MRSASGDVSDEGVGDGDEVVRRELEVEAAAAAPLTKTLAWRDADSSMTVVSKRWPTGLIPPTTPIASTASSP